MDALIVLLTLIVLLGAYFVPTIVAFSRRHHNRFAILALDVFLGWTLLGWVLALVWSLTAVNPEAHGDTKVEAINRQS